MNDYDAKKALQAAADFKRANNGKASPDLESAAKAECAKLKNHYTSQGVTPPQWLRNS